MRRAPASEPSIGSVRTGRVWDGDAVAYLDCSAYSRERFATNRARTVEELEAAIGSLAVRGAPCIGVFAAYGIAALRQGIAGDEEFFAAAQRVRRSRPTAVNLAWAVDRVLAAADPLAEARAIHEEQIEIDALIGENEWSSSPRMRAS